MRIHETGTPPEAVWMKVADALKGEMGEGPFNSYVAPSTLRPGFLRFALFGDPDRLQP